MSEGEQSDPINLLSQDLWLKILSTLQTADLNDVQQPKELVDQHYLYSGLVEATATGVQSLRRRLQGKRLSLERAGTWLQSAGQA